MVGEVVGEVVAEVGIHLHNEALAWGGKERTYWRGWCTTQATPGVCGLQRACWWARYEGLAWWSSVCGPDNPIAVGAAAAGGGEGPT